MKANKMGHFTYRTTWSEEDREYVGLCLEFPSLSVLAKTPVDAVEGIYKLVKDVVQDMEKNGEQIPDPISEKKFSGKFIVRVPPDTHKRLAIEAAEHNVSLNRLISEKLAHCET
jgi:predicted HicB family RNase H-like nuclease